MRKQNKIKTVINGQEVTVEQDSQTGQFFTRQHIGNIPVDYATISDRVTIGQCIKSWRLRHGNSPAEQAERIGVAVYGLVIAAMLYSALQYDGACAAGFRCAALLFVFSDAVIAWNRFIGPVPARTWIVMTTYYLAQYLFFRFAFKTAARN